MNRSGRPAVGLALMYVSFASAWIIGSDWMLGLLPTSVEASLQTVKGLVFVVVTGLVLFLLVQRMHDDIVRGMRQARSAEVLLQQVIDTVPVGVLFVNDDGIITFMNPAAEQLVSISAAHGVGLSLEELCCADSADSATRVGELLRTGAADGMRLGRPGEQSPRAFVARARAVDPEANTSGWVVALADITESHRAGERLERLMDAYRFLVEALILCGRATEPRQLLSQVAELAIERGGYSAAWAMLKADAGTGFVDAAALNLGEQATRTAELLRTQAIDSHNTVTETLLSPEVSVSNDIARDPAHSWYSAAEESGLGSSASFGVLGPAGMRASLTVFSSASGYFDAEEVHLLRQLQRALAFALEKIGLDRERLLAEEALELSEHNYKQLFLSHPMPLWVYDLESLGFLAVNDAAMRKYGWNCEEFLRMTIADIRPTTEIPALLENVGKVSGGFEDAGVWTHVDKSGRAFPVHVYSHPLEWEGRRAELVMVQEVARMG